MDETGAWKAEQRYRAVLELRDGSPVSEIAVRYGVSRQTIHTWRNRYEQDGVAGSAGGIATSEADANPGGRRG